MVILIWQFSAVIADQNGTTVGTSLEQTIEQKLAAEEADNFNRVGLKRKRRYLEFPEGSSFQLGKILETEYIVAYLQLGISNVLSLVYDLIVGVVDYTNYLILGVTVALAWELPSKPPSEILNDLTERLKDGTLGTTRNDTISNIKYVDTKTSNVAPVPNKYYSNLQPLFKPPMHWQYYAGRHPDSYYRTKDYSKWQGNGGLPKSWRRKDGNYFSRNQQHPFTKWTQNTATPKKTSAATAKYPWWNLATRYDVLGSTMCKRNLVTSTTALFHLEFSSSVLKKN